ncbi:MAG TPA: hypothetical protein VGB82_06685 [Alphaproteobacteria bacterium]
MRTYPGRRFIALSAVTMLAALAACSTAQPTIAYRIVGGDVTEANATNIRALQYCQQEYRRGARLRSYSGNTAIYTCSGPATVAAVPVAPAAPGY